MSTLQILKVIRTLVNCAAYETDEEKKVPTCKFKVIARELQLVLVKHGINEN